MAIEKDKSTTARADQPNQPVATFLQEAHNLYVWSSNDAEILASIGITREMIEDLPLRTEACKEAQAQWDAYRNTASEAEKQWKLLARQAIKFRAKLLSAMRYAFRKEANLQVPLSTISKGTGYADLIQDLNDLAVLGRNNKDLLLHINFDLTLLDKAAAKSEELGELWATAKTERDAQPEIKKNRNITFWHLHELLTEIRSAGRYVFRDDKSRYIGYTSTYWKNKYNKRAKPNKLQASNSTDTD